MLRDVRDGGVSPEAAREHYGVLLAPDVRGVDWETTARRPATVGGTVTSVGNFLTACLIRVHHRAYDNLLGNVMNFVSVRELRSRSAAVWSSAVCSWIWDRVPL